MWKIFLAYPSAARRDGRPKKSVIGLLRNWVLTT
jgi:hypothetical protein